jgi:hypothetical protein
MTFVVDIQHWLDEQGDPVPRLRKRVLQMARLIEAGGPLALGEMRETLVECNRRPQRRPCQGLLWVTKATTDTIEAYCLVCDHVYAVISGWEDTIWAEGPMPPFHPDELPSQPESPANNRWQLPDIGGLANSSSEPKLPN